MGIRPIIRGLATYVPVLRNHVGTRTGGTDSARYCYSVWARHLAMAEGNGLNSNPRIVAELGPGDSIGIGLAALISGCERYYAFDVVRFATTDRNLEIFDQIVELFRQRAPIPGPDEFPKIKPGLDSWDFPRSVFTDSRLEASLAPARLEAIRESVVNPERNDSVIQSRIPWYDAGVIAPGDVDMIFSQAVLEHVDDLDNTYAAMHRWLKPSGFMSHQVDFKCHFTADEWNGHWAHSDFVWRIIRGRYAYLLNRQPWSVHRDLIARHGFRLVTEQLVSTPSRLSKQDLAPRFRTMSDEDLVTSGAFFIAAPRV